MSSDDDLPPLLIDTSDLKVQTDTFDAVPVTIVTGYLGSGKSTLLKHVLQSNHGKRIALVLNEFGETSDIEKSLNIRNTDSDGSQTDQWVELDNGCMCCTAKDSGVAAIEKLMERQGRYDYIIIETSGLADPAPIASMFWLDDALQSKVKLDGVITVVDAHTIMKSLSEGELASLQIACADLILINKCDLATNDQLEEVENAVHAINAAALIAHSKYGDVDTGQCILDLNAYSSESALETVKKTELCADEHCEHDHTHSPHDLSTIALRIPLLSKKAFEEIEAKIQHVLWENRVGENNIVVHRLKGKLQIEDRQTKIVQGVRDIYEIIDVEYEPDGICKLVFIGTGLLKARSALEDTFCN